MDRKTFSAWLKIFRIPNLFTVPGEATAGYLLCGGDPATIQFAYLILASLCFYSFGLVTNDIADFKEDRVSRPERPLPSGNISIEEASGAAFILAAGALAFSFLAGTKVLFLGLLMLVSIIAYNFLSPRNAIFPGSFIISVCRLLNIMLGVSAAENQMLRPILLISLLLCETLYIFGLSTAASRETKSDRTYAIAGAILIYFSLFIFIAGSLLSVSKIIRYAGEIPPPVKIAILFWGLSLIVSIAATRRWFFAADISKIPSDIGTLIRNLVIIQAAACAFAGFAYASLLIFLLVIPSTILSRRYYQS